MLRVPAAVSALALVLALSGARAHAQDQASSQANQASPQANAAGPAQPADSNSAVLQEVVVSGQRQAVATAQRIKQMSSQIVDSVVAADIGKLPDRSVTEVMQRIPGITIDHTYVSINGVTDPEHFQAEGAGVQIRGLTYVSSLINGQDSFSANNGRALSFDDVPPELLAGVDVYKNPDASQIEGGIGGVVDLRTAKPFDFSGARISGSVGGTWGDLSRGNVKPSASLLLSDRWHTGIGDFGVLVDVADTEAQDRTDGMELYPYFPRTNSTASTDTWVPQGQTVWIPDGGVTWRTLRFKRTRKGIYTAVQWRPTDNIETSLSYFGSYYKFHWDENAIFPQTDAYHIQPAPGTSFTFNPAGVLTSGTMTDPTDGGLPMNDDTRSADQHSATDNFSWNLVWHATDNLKLTTDAQLVRSANHADDFTVATGVNVPYETVNLTGRVPTASVPAAYMQNPDNYYWAFTQDGEEFGHGQEYAWREDAEYAFDHGFFKSIRAGLRWEDRSAETDLTEPGSGYNWAAVSQTWMTPWEIPTLAYLNKFPAPYATYGFPNFFNGNATVPAPVIFPATSLATGWPGTFAQLQSFFTDLCKELNPNCVNGWKPASFTSAPGAPPAGGLNTQDEHTYAAYLMLPFGSQVGATPFDGDIGVRVVKSVDAASGYLVVGQFTPGNPPAGFTLADYVSFNASAQPFTANNDYTDVLPDLNMRLHWTDHLQSHLALSEGMARPQFSQLQAFTSVGSNINSSTGVQSFTGAANGNPNLKPTKSFNVDGTLEWYFAPTGSLTADVFYKHLTDVVINQVFNVTATDTAGTAHTFTTTGPVNGATGDIKGFEIAYQQYFDFLPSLLRGLGTQLNFTYIDSQQTLNSPVSGHYCDNTSDSAANLSLNLNGCDTNGTTFGNLPLVNLSKDAFNAALLYDRGPVSARLAYSWRSKYLMGVNVNPLQGTSGTNTDPSSPGFGSQSNAWALPIYAAAYGELDASIFYKIGEHVQLGFEALNLTDSLYRELMQQHIQTSTFAWYDSGRT
ncbi:MAG TPA: TonB-dependent receptor, partial [Steroidobacteraceae bacterium]|nr:TonB-dependent receptor [Steroidobacteraceae bacterium]